MMKTAVRRQRKDYRLLFYALPFLILILLFHYIPLFGWVISFFEYKPGRALANTSFLGVKYFVTIFTDTDVLRALINTLIFSSINYVLFPLPMVIAILLSEIRVTWYRKAAQTLTTVPHFISWVIVYSMAYAVFSSEGLLNSALAALGSNSEYKLLTDKNAVYIFQTFIGQWKHFGWNTIVYIAAIASLDQDIFEAASIDGASRFQKVLYITIPGLMPTFIVLLIIGVGRIINTGYEQYYVFKNPVISEKIEVLDLYIYRMGLQLHDYSYATAVGILKSIVSITMVFSVNKIAGKVRGSTVL